MLEETIIQKINQNSDYWTERFEKLEQSTHNEVRRYNENAKKQFEESAKIINSYIRNFYIQFSELENINYGEAVKLLNSDELEAFHLTVEQYIAMGEALSEDFNKDVLKTMREASLRVRVSRLEALQLEIQGEIAKLHSNMQTSMFEQLAYVYEQRYYHTCYELENGAGMLGVSFSRLNNKQIQKALERPWCADGVRFSDRIWSNQDILKRNLDDLITQSTIIGRSYPETAKLLNERMQTGYNNCARIVATESAAIATSAQKEGFEELGVEMYEIVATLDRRTSQICQAMDGKRFKMSEFEEGLTAPPFHPNCRTHFKPYFEGEETGDEKRVARINGKSKFVKNMTYSEWADKYDIEPIYGRPGKNPQVEVVDGKLRLKK